MLRRQIINKIRRYNHQHCEKNISQINCNNLFETNEKRLDLIQKQIQENNKKINKGFDDIQNNIGISFCYSIISTIIIMTNII